MSNYNHQEDGQVPDLVPMKRKFPNNPYSIATPSENKSVKSDFINNIIKDSIKKTPKHEQQKQYQQNMEESAKFSKKDQPQKKSKDQNPKTTRKDIIYTKIQNQRTKQNEKMKALIAQMLNSMSVKNLSEQLYPVSNQVMERMLMEIQQEITDLTYEMEKKQTSNQNDFHVKKELEAIKREIDHCCLIKELYYEKMNYRDKVKNLQEEIISLRAENRDLKLKVCRGIESIQNYKHNLPCDREKQLIQKLSICTQQLSQEKQMRQNLEKNIESIIMNFKKLYQQADGARQIVTKKLKQVQQREKKLKKSKDLEQQAESQQKKRLSSFDFGEQKKSNSYLQSSIDFNNTKKTAEQDIKKSPLRSKPSFKQKQQQQKQRQKQKQKEDKKKATGQGLFEAMTLQEKIRKMRNNQENFKKIGKN